jgi:hypothetical protein
MHKTPTNGLKSEWQRLAHHSGLVFWSYPTFVGHCLVTNQLRLLPMAHRRTSQRETRLKQERSCGMQKVVEEGSSSWLRSS